MYVVRSFMAQLDSCVLSCTVYRTARSFADLVHVLPHADLVSVEGCYGRSRLQASGPPAQHSPWPSAHEVDVGTSGHVVDVVLVTRPPVGRLRMLGNRMDVDAPPGAQRYAILLASLIARTAAQRAEHEIGHPFEPHGLRVTPTHDHDHRCWREAAADRLVDGAHATRAVSYIAEEAVRGGLVHDNVLHLQGLWKTFMARKPMEFGVYNWLILGLVRLVG